MDQQTLSTSSEGRENSEGEWAISRGHLTLMVPAADGQTVGGRSRRSLSTCIFTGRQEEVHRRVAEASPGQFHPKFFSAVTKL